MQILSLLICEPNIHILELKEIDHNLHATRQQEITRSTPRESTQFSMTTYS